MAKKQLVTSERMRTLIASYYTSDMTQRAFCEQHNLSVGTFQYWYRKFNKEGVPASSGFTELQMESRISEAQIVVRYPSGIEVQIPLF